MAHAPHVKVKPPVIFSVFLLAGLAVNYLEPIPLFGSMREGALAGVPLIVIGFSLLSWAVRTFSSVKVDPRFKPVPQLVTAGPYAYTRNPMYVGFTLVYLGIAFALNAGWPLLFLALTLATLHYHVIIEEEAYLEELFDEEYRKYRRKVRRWL